MATQTSLSKDDIIAAIGNMSVFELAELIEAFKAKFNVTIAAPVAAAPAAGGAAGGAAAPAGGEQTEGSVVRKSGGGKKITGTKEVRAGANPGVKGAQGLGGGGGAGKGGAGKQGSG